MWKSVIVLRRVVNPTHEILRIKKTYTRGMSAGLGEYLSVVGGFRWKIRKSRLWRKGISE